MRLSPMQIICLGAFLMATYCVQLEPRFFVQETGQTAWQVVWLSGMVGMVYLLVYFGILKMCPSGFGEALHSAFGFWPSRLIGLLYLIFLLLYPALNLSLLNFFSGSTTLVMSPPWLISLFITLTSAYAAQKGIQSIARISELWFFLSCFAAAVLLLLATRQAEWGHLLPLLPQDAASFLATGLKFSRIPAETFFLVFLAAFLGKTKEALKTMTAGIIISVFWLSSFTLFAVAILGVPMVKISSFPIVTMVRSIYITEILQRFDVLLLTVWLGSIFIRCSLMLFIFDHFTADILCYHPKGLLAFPGAILAWAWGSYMFNNLLDFQAFYLEPWRNLILLANVLIPAIVFLVISLKRRLAACA